MSFDPRIVFYDPLCPAPYTRQTLETRALGGSEATAVRVVESLDASLMQHCRRNTEGRYRAPAPAPEAEHVIVLRDARALPRIRHLFPHACFHLWLHDLVAPGSTRARWLADGAEILSDGSNLICVSEFLRRRVESVLPELPLRASVALRVIFNPIADELAPAASEFDDGKLVYLSSPNKGLGYGLTAFMAIRRVMPKLSLCVANPGYRQSPSVELPGVTWVGTLPPAQAVELARSALCVFMPNFRLPETFGLVYAEANAVGTPVLAHEIGAAREVLHPQNPLLPVRPGQRRLGRIGGAVGWRGRSLLASVALRIGIFDDYIDQLRRWQSGQRPDVAGAERFRLSSVREQWRALLR